MLRACCEDESAQASAVSQRVAEEQLPSRLSNSDCFAIRMKEFRNVTLSHQVATAVGRKKLCRVVNPFFFDTAADVDYKF